MNYLQILFIACDCCESRNEREDNTVWNGSFQGGLYFDVGNYLSALLNFEQSIEFFNEEDGSISARNTLLSMVSYGRSYNSSDTNPSSVTLSNNSSIFAHWNVGRSLFRNRAAR
jgi:hypothetical protein